MFSAFTFYLRSPPRIYRYWVMFAVALSAPLSFAADKFERLCVGRNDTAPVFVTRDVKGVIERMEVILVDAVGPTTSAVVGNTAKVPKVTYELADAEEIQSICRAGVSVAVMPKPDTRKSDASKVLPAEATLPINFTIMTSDTIFCKGAGNCFRNVYGGFWVPGTMPPEHNAHLTEYTVAMNNFHNAVNSAHFVNSVLTVSDTNLTNDFDGKGVIFGYDTTFCGSPQPTYGSVAETWVIQPLPTVEVKVFSGLSPGYYPNVSNLPPTTCAAMTPNATYRFLVGANRQQESQHWRYLGSATTPDYPPPGSNFIDYVVNNSFNAAFRPNGAGVAFFVGGGGGAGMPIPPTWTLTFSAASHWTL